MKFFILKRAGKFLAPILALVLCLGAVGGGAVAAGPGDSFMAFFSEAAELIRDGWEESYFSGVAMEIGSSVAYIDGKELEITPPAIVADELFLPLGEIAVIVGCETPEGEARLFSEDSAWELGLDVHRDGDTVIVTRPYQMKQLVVQTRDNGTLRNSFGASRSVTDGNGLYLLQYGSEEETVAARAALEDEPNVLYALPNKVVCLRELESPNEAVLAALDPPNTLPSDMRWGADLIAADLMKDYLTNDLGITDELAVAVIDSGIDTTHEMFAERLAEGINLVNPEEPMSDGNGHGTHVSGTIVDCTPDNILIVPVKVLDEEGMTTSEFHVSMGISFAILAEADVINMSLGGYCDEDDCLEKRAIDKAVAAGVTVVVAAGNDGDDVMLACPAKLTNVVTVAATDENDHMAYFSNYGSAVDISAPGVDVYSSYPNDIPPDQYDDGETPYATHSGTSMASPHVAAAAAMLKLENSLLGPEEIKAALQAATVDLGEPGWDPKCGTGRLDLRLHMDSGLNIPATGISLSTDSLSLPYNSLSNMIHINPSFTPMEATDKSFLVDSSNPGVAYFDSLSGAIKVAEPGKTTITIYAGSLSYSCEIEITESEHWLDYAAESYAGGNGTASSPYLIETPEQLARLSAEAYALSQEPFDPDSYVEEHFKLIADIDLAGKQWIPISAWYYDEFYFDGGYHQIRNMTIDLNYSNADAIGLFSELACSTVKNLGLVDAVVDCGFYGVGLLAGIIYEEATLTGCFTTGISSGAGLVGGLIEGAEIRDCYSTASAESGGLVGFFEGGIIANSYASGEVAALEDEAGFGDGAGLIHEMDAEDAGVVVNSFAANLPESGIGFIGERAGGSVTKCYYLEGNPYAIWHSSADSPVAAGDLQARDIDFFGSEESFTDAKNWSSQYPWDFDGTWELDPEINGGLPILRGFEYSLWDNPYTDVPASAWYYDDVRFVTEAGLMNGTGSASFSPGLSLTRGMLVTILYRLAESPAVGEAAPFQDVQDGKYYSDAVLWAAENGVVQGYDGFFRPEVSVSRQDFAVIMWRYADYCGVDVSAGEDADISFFNDASAVADYAVSAMRWAYVAGVIGGRPGAVLDPQGQASRAEAAAILHRFLEGYFIA